MSGLLFKYQNVCNQLDCIDLAWEVDTDSLNPKNYKLFKNGIKLLKEPFNSLVIASKPYHQLALVVGRLVCGYMNFCVQHPGQQKDLANSLWLMIRPLTVKKKSTFAQVVRNDEMYGAFLKEVLLN
ncbi:hypothetical protein K0U07_01590 [bacterium]|nr:hypothetical protein [bacterium]